MLQLIDRNSLPLWLVVVSFGPYVWMGAGLRAEHLLIYSLVPLAALVLPFQRRGILAFPPLAAVVAVLAFVTVWTSLVTFLGPRNYDSAFRAIAHFENYLQPLAIILVLAVLAKPHGLGEALGLFRGVCRVLIWFLLLNTFVAMASMFWDLSGLLAPFIGLPDQDGYTVWQRAALMGRFSGVFNQPMESGLTYSLGLFAWAYLARAKRQPSSADYVALALLVLGGVLSVSKVFILGGIPLFIAYWLSLASMRQVVSWRLAVVAFAALGSVGFLLERWIGFEYMLRLFRPGDGGASGLLYLYTAERFGEQGTLVQELFADVWFGAPVQGFGFASANPLDNAYIEFLYQGGLVALAGYLAILVVLGWLGLKQYLQRHEEGRFLLCLLAFIVGAGIGAPVLTINRFSTVFWVFFCALCCVAWFRRREASAGAEAGVTQRTPAVAISSGN